MTPYSDFGWCPLQYGNYKTPTDTSLGVTENEGLVLGKIYKSKGPDGRVRLVRIVKNASSSTLAARKLVKSSTATGRYLLDAASLTTDDGDPILGVVEEGYSGGVPDGKWFRCVVYAEKMGVYISSDNSSRVTNAVGDVVVAADDNGSFWAQDNTADTGLAVQIQNRLGRILEATTNNSTYRGTVRQVQVNVIS